MRKTFQRLIRTIGVMVCTLAVFMGTTMPVYAVTGETHFGSNYYLPAYDEQFPIGIYLNTDEVIGDYEIHMAYDTRFLEYVDGATEGGNGEVVVSGNLQGQSLRVLVNFRALAVGNTSLRVTSVTGSNLNQDDNLTIEEYPVAPISISAANLNNEIRELTVNGAGIEGFSPEVTEYELTAPYEGEIQVLGDGAELEYSTDEEVDGTQNVYVTYDTADNVPVIYTLHVTWDRSNYVEENEQQDISEEQVESAETVQNVADKEEVSENVAEDTSSRQDKNHAVNQKIAEKKQTDMLKAVVVLGGLALVMVLVVIGKVISDHRRRKRIEQMDLDGTMKNDSFYEDLEVKKR